MTFPFDRRFLFVTGKGGVGKSTVTAALALALARRGRRVLVATSGARERLSTLFGVAPFTAESRLVAAGVWGVRIDVDAAMREYGGMMLKSRTVYDAVFDSRLVQGFLAGVPGLHEWAILGKVWYHSTETDGAGRHRFDTVIHDAPATGHGLEMLRVPKVIVDLVPPGILRRDAERAWHDLTDPIRSGVVVVALPEELPTTEALELVEALTSELGLPIAAVVANGVLEPLFTPAERQALLAAVPSGLAQPGDVGSSGEAGLMSAARRAIREELQAEHLARLAAVAAAYVELPLLPHGAMSLPGASTLAERFG
ncbi:MAG: P-loop NTPase [Polyangiaceae bacterium]|nr:P-loop NTPase [Polyangiaceae bacterium]